MIPAVEGSNVHPNSLFRKTAPVFLFLTTLILLPVATAGPLAWPMRCADGSERNCVGRIGYPDLAEKNIAYDCGKPGYQGHTGTDFAIKENEVGKNHEVLAAAAGRVIFINDGKYDNCPNNHPDCNTNPPKPYFPGYDRGVTTCSNTGPYCNGGISGLCFWCFTGGNFVVIEHESVDEVFATYYAHLRTGSVAVSVGDEVEQGDFLGMIASSGHSTGHHLHFEVWETGYYQQVDPWPGPCGTNTNKVLWQTPEQKALSPTPEKIQEKEATFSQFD